MHRLLTFIVLGLLGCSDDTAVRRDLGGADKPATIVDKTTTGEKPAIQPDGTVAKDGIVAKDGGGCQTTTKKVEEFAPATNEVTGWAIDAAKTNCAGYSVAEIANNKDCVDIDGHVDQFGKTGLNGMVQRYYRKGGVSLQVRIWDMKTATGAKDIFNYWKTKDETDGGWVFTDIPNAPERAVIGKDARFTAYGYKCNYMWEMFGNGPNWGPFPTPADADAAKPEIIAFVQHLAGKKLP